MYQEMYTHLFNAMTDALEALAAHNYGQAETLLRQAQLRRRSGTWKRSPPLDKTGPP